jgi:hypothetical protein
MMKIGLSIAILSTTSVAIAAPQEVQLPDAIPVLCLDSAGTYQPMQGTDYGHLRTAFRSQFGFTGHLTPSSERTGTLTFRGGQRGAETISYSVKPRTDGLALLSMRVRLHGVSEELRGDEMCWRTFSIVNIR